MHYTIHITINTVHLSIHLKIKYSHEYHWVTYDSPVVQMLEKSENANKTVIDENFNTE